MKTTVVEKTIRIIRKVRQKKNRRGKPEDLEEFRQAMPE
jgi:hypothetical protein